MIVAYTSDNEDMDNAEPIEGEVVGRDVLFSHRPMKRYLQISDEAKTALFGTPEPKPLTVWATIIAPKPDWDAWYFDAGHA